MTPTYRFTVVLQRPDYRASNYGQDTYINHVEVQDNDVCQALSAARLEVCTIDGSDRPEDYFCIAVFEGHQTSVYRD